MAHFCHVWRRFLNGWWRVVLMVVPCSAVIVVMPLVTGEHLAGSGGDSSPKNQSKAVQKIHPVRVQQMN